jgi:hypothetical protein
MPIRRVYVGEESYQNKADTFGLLLSIGRRDMINDDLGAVTTVPRKLGRGSGLKINDVFWAIFLANSSFVTSGNRNYLTGADTALSIRARRDNRPIRQGGQSCVNTGRKRETPGGDFRVFPYNPTVTLFATAIVGSGNQI